ncbi:sulfite exporter TauE/SafE family protein [Armatimonas sp.]|uniref:sulfite exporter TauE/SafE family protein n=1 Tax=Armatimonas sp. TaxID=1872638 RepID=UPI00286BBFAB|nr:sulfite exporter TauE/SafE family protein [Armatimonas sp.]
MTLEMGLALAGFAIATGLALGTLGAGGAILAVPAFSYAAHLPHREASATSLLVVGTAALIGGLLTLRRCKNNPEEAKPDFKVALPFVLSGLVGSWGGALLSKHVPELALKLLFGAVVLAAAEAMYLRSTASAQESSQKTAPAWLTPLIGLGAGLLTGLVGVGGGFMIVPALTVVGKLSLKRASATSVWIIAGNAAAALTGYIGKVHIAWGMAGAFLAVTLVAMSIGQRFARHANPKTLQRLFAAFLLVIGIVTLIKR